LYRYVKYGKAALATAAEKGTIEGRGLHSSTLYAFTRLRYLPLPMKNHLNASVEPRVIIKMHECTPLIEALRALCTHGAAVDFESVQGYTVGAAQLLKRR
jgi:hypothetical protein